ncbi:MAG: hypothetical protein LBK74_08625, partial [Treponema sp.]|nr:hypothetical protein [Treponema sp.]
MKKPAGETKHILKVKVYEEWIRRPCGMPRFLVEQRIAEQYHISVSSVRRYIRNIDKYGYTPPVRPRQGRRVFAWDPAALDFMKAFYLAARRDAGYCTMRNAYLRTVAAAQEKGWKVGSEQSAYTHLRDIHSLLLTYASAAVLGRTGTAVCSAAGFPHGAASQAAKSAELRECIRRGAAEMDVAVNILALKSGEADACRRELQEMLQIA